MLHRYAKTVMHVLNASCLLISFEFGDKRCGINSVIAILLTLAGNSTEGIAETWYYGLSDLYVVHAFDGTVDTVSLVNLFFVFCIFISRIFILHIHPLTHTLRFPTVVSS